MTATGRRVDGDHGVAAPRQPVSLLSTDVNGASRSGKIAGALVASPFLLLLCCLGGGIGHAVTEGVGPFSAPIGVWIGTAAVGAVGLCALLVVSAARRGVWLEGDALVFGGLRSRRVELARARSVALLRIRQNLVRKSRRYVVLVLSVTDERGAVRWLQLRRGGWIVVAAPEMRLLADALRRTDAPGAGETADALAALAANPGDEESIPLAVLPRLVRWSRWTALLAPLVGVLVFPLMFIVPMLASDASARRVPENVCALVPADLLARLVPAGQMDTPESSYSSSYKARTTCEVRTDQETASTTAGASLSIELERYAGKRIGFSDAEDEAQDQFASHKAYPLTATSGYRVADLSGLGDSAYLAVREPPAPTKPGGTVDNWSVQVVVLRADAVLTVGYTASPTDERRAASAAVAVTRALLKELP